MKSAYKYVAHDPEGKIAASLFGDAYAICEIAQRLADERDELRDALEDAMKIIGMHAMESAAKWTSEPQEIADNADRALAPYRAILAKYPKP
jgi:hypothetical protein